MAKVELPKNTSWHGNMTYRDLGLKLIPREKIELEVLHI